MTPRPSRPGTSHPVTALWCSHHSPVICQTTFPTCHRLARSAFVRWHKAEVLRGAIASTAIGAIAAVHSAPSDRQGLTRMTGHSWRSGGLTFVAVVGESDPSRASTLPYTPPSRPAVLGCSSPASKTEMFDNEAFAPKAHRRPQRQIPQEPGERRPYLHEAGVNGKDPEFVA